MNWNKDYDQNKKENFPLPCPSTRGCICPLLSLDRYWHLHCHIEPPFSGQLYFDQSMKNVLLIQSTKIHPLEYAKDEYWMERSLHQLQNLNLKPHLEFNIRISRSVLRKNLLRQKPGALSNSIQQQTKNKLITPSSAQMELKETIVLEFRAGRLIVSTA